MNYAAELRKFITSQYVYSGVRIALAIVIPSIILAYFGLLKEYFLFPLATSFVGLTDQPGPFIRRRNSLILAIFFFILIAATASILKDFPVLIFLEIIIFGIFFSMIGVYGQRLAAVGGLSLVVFSIFIDGHLSGENLLVSVLVFGAGCIWFLLIFLVVSTLQPYKLAGQMIGENYLELSNYLKIKARFYQLNPDFESLYKEIIAQQVTIKNLQEDTRELMFKTRTIVNESTTTSRLLMLMFLNSIDLYEKLMTADQDYNKLHEKFDDSGLLSKIHHYLLDLANELTNIGIALQSGQKTKPVLNIEEEHQNIQNLYFDLRNSELSAANLENFMSLRLIMLRINELTEDIRSIYAVLSQDVKLAKSLSTGLDFKKFMPQEEKLNLKVLLQNFSLKSAHFRHSLRITAALLFGYAFSQLQFLGIGHSYWILITIIAIMRPAYSTTKHRNLLRLYGTVAGAVVAYGLLIFVTNQTVLLFLMLSNMILCFALLKGKYSWAVFFMTIYIFIAFNFLNPGNVNGIFKDRILDTIIAGGIAFLVSYFVFPVWEHTKTPDLMKMSSASNSKYFEAVISRFNMKEATIQDYKIKRKEAVITLANLSDSFQRMLSEPKNRQKNITLVHQFVTTGHLITAYIASLSQYANSENNYPEIDLETWNKKIAAELDTTSNFLQFENNNKVNPTGKNSNPDDLVDDLLRKRKKEIDENEFFDRRDPQKVTYLTELKNIRELLGLLYDTAHEQRKVAEKFAAEV